MSGPTTFCVVHEREWVGDQGESCPWCEVERLKAKVLELETPDYYWDDRDLETAFEPEVIGDYDDVGDIFPYRPIHELPTRWARVTEGGVEWYETEEAADAAERDK